MESLAALDNLYTYIMSFTLIYMRVFSMIYTISIFRKEMATVRIIASLAFVISLYPLLLFPHVNSNTHDLSFSFMLEGMTQTLIGFCTGMIINILLDIFVAAGQIISIQIGLSTASLFDPRFGMVTSLTQFYLITATVLFFGMNGHLIILSTIINSFKSIPADISLNQLHLVDIVNYSTNIYSGSVSLSVTIISATLIVNICLAIISKFAPQFNLFSVGINMTLLIGLVCILVTYQIVINKGENYIENGLSLYQHYVLNMSKR